MGRIHELSPEWPHSDHFTGLGIILVFSDLFFFFFSSYFRVPETQASRSSRAQLRKPKWKQASVGVPMGGGTRVWQRQGLLAHIRHLP